MNTTARLPQFVRDLIASTPRAGEGVHHYLFRVARQLHAHLPATEIVRLLEDRVADCGRDVPRGEIEDAVKNSIPCAWQPNQSGASRPAQSKWPGVNQEQLEAIVRNEGGLADLWELSPIRLEDSTSHCEEIIDRLFAGNLLLCCGRYAKKPNGESYTAFDTKPRENWRGELASLELIVPSPMKSIFGTTKKGHQSKHTLDATAPRRFLVVECDFSILARDGKTETKLAPLIRKLNQDGIEVADMCAAVLIHLASYAPLVCAVHSGGKSTHGWFFVDGQPEDKALRFLRYAVSLGADDATWSRSQFVRMPDGTRDNGKPQRVYFLNFKPLEAK